MSICRSFGIIEKNDSRSERRWRENLDQWIQEVGQQDPFPGVRKHLILKYRPPAGSDDKYLWRKITQDSFPLGPSLSSSHAGYGLDPPSKEEEEDDACKFSVGVPAGRGGHCAYYGHSQVVGLGGLFVLGGSARPGARTPFPLPSLHLNSISSDIRDAFHLLLVICPRCACPLVDYPRR